MGICSNADDPYLKSAKFEYHQENKRVSRKIKQVYYELVEW